MFAPTDEELSRLLSKSDAVYEHTALSNANVGKAWWSNTNAMTMCSLVLVFGLLAMLLATWIAVHKTNSQKDMTILRVVVIPMVIVAGMFFVVAGYDNQQVNGFLGLLGTILGFVIGRHTSDGTKPEGETKGDAHKKEPAKAEGNIPG